MKKVNVNSNCIGCGACVSIEPSVFDFNDDGYACVKEDVDVTNLSEEIKENVIDASESCPVDAIEVEK